MNTLSQRMGASQESEKDEFYQYDDEGQMTPRCEDDCRGLLKPASNKEKLKELLGQIPNELSCHGCGETIPPQRLVWVCEYGDIMEDKHKYRVYCCTCVLAKCQRCWIFYCGQQLGFKKAFNGNTVKIKGFGPVSGLNSSAKTKKDKGHDNDCKENK